LNEQGSDPRQFRILRLVSEGGFGRVYLAEMLDGEGMTRLVALKVHRDAPDLAEDRLARFRDEARMLARIHHHALVPALALVRLPLGWTMVLDWVDGVDAAAFLDGTPVPPRVVLELVAEVASALVEAWNTPGDDGQPLQLIHRDLKPQNIRYTVHGEVRLLDLGAARGSFAAREARTTVWVLGTAAYMAPERMDSGQEGPEGDVWSLGLVAADLLRGVGRPPIRLSPRNRETLLSKIEAELDQSWTEASRAQRVEVCELIERMTTLEPELRPTMIEVRDHAARLADTVPGPRPKSWTSQRVRALQATLPPHPEEDPWAGRTVGAVPATASTPTFVEPTETETRWTVGAVPIPAPTPAPEPDPTPAPLPPAPRPAWGIPAALLVLTLLLAGFGLSRSWTATAPGEPTPLPEPEPVTPTPSPTPSVELTPTPSPTRNPPKATPTPKSTPKSTPTPAPRPAPTPAPPPAAITTVAVDLIDSPYPTLTARPEGGGAPRTIPGSLPPGTWKLYDGDSFRGQIQIGGSASATVRCNVGQARKCALK
jgi:serine/threonine protein kinase